MNATINTALVSVFNKDGLDVIVRRLNELGVKLYSTGGTLKFIEDLGIKAQAVEDLTEYPSILDGRVKTLHPKVFGGILARREQAHLDELNKYAIPTFDLVIVDLYPFEETLKNTTDKAEIIEKIDIGGSTLIRSAAKNFNDVLVCPSRDSYEDLQRILEKGNQSSLDDRKHMATQAFLLSSHYDTLIADWMQGDIKQLRYGENPHQKAIFNGDLDAVVQKVQGKDISYNNMLDMSAAVELMDEFKDDRPCFAIFKHTNSCGLAMGSSVLEAYQRALACDPISAFGGILISNGTIDARTAALVNELFYEIIIAPAYEEDALNMLKSKKNRIILILKSWPKHQQQKKSILNGELIQDRDVPNEDLHKYAIPTKLQPTEKEMEDLKFANIAVKHLKSNAIALVRDQQLIGMGCGQSSRIDALGQAIEKAKKFNFHLQGAVMASDAFFPFPDCVELASKHGIKAIIQPGGSKNDQMSIDASDASEMSMVMTSVRHFKH